LRPVSSSTKWRYVARSIGGYDRNKTIHRMERLSVPATKKLLSKKE
jgi:hypothetical protein